MNTIDLSHKTFNRWTVISRAENTSTGQAQWLCRCICGNEKALKSIVIRRGISKSCGCWKKESPNPNYRHGHSSNTFVSPTYHTWAGMIARCTNPMNTRYARYGGRGITICKRWSTFKNFLADMGEKPKGKSIDRINNDGNYCKENCRWATPKQQRRNRSDFLK